MLWSCGSREKLLSTATAVGRPCSAASTSILSKLWSRGVNPHFTVRVVAEDAAGLLLAVDITEAPAPECVEVAITKVSTGAAFVFEDRGIPLPLFVV